VGGKHPAGPADAQDALSDRTSSVAQPRRVRVRAQ
jgi:hypothetical protein